MEMNACMEPLEFLQTLRKAFVWLLVAQESGGSPDKEEGG